MIITQKLRMPRLLSFSESLPSKHHPTWLLSYLLPIYPLHCVLWNASSIVNTPHYKVHTKFCSFFYVPLSWLMIPLALSHHHWLFPLAYHHPLHISHQFLLILSLKSYLKVTTISLSKDSHHKYEKKILNIFAQMWDRSQKEQNKHEQGRKDGEGQQGRWHRHLEKVKTNTHCTRQRFLSTDYIQSSVQEDILIAKRLW